MADQRSSQKMDENSMPSFALQVSAYSDASTILIDTPIPIGSPPTPPAPLIWPTKDAADIRNYNVDFGPALSGIAGNEILTADIEITPNQEGDLVLVNLTAVGFLLVLWLSEGYSGVTYIITLNVVSVSAQTIQRSISLQVA
jgi:hypothetical protein